MNVTYIKLIGNDPWTFYSLDNYNRFSGGNMTNLIPHHCTYYPYQSFHIATICELVFFFSIIINSGIYIVWQLWMLVISK